MLPDTLRYGLRYLTDADATAIWEYLDGTPDAIGEMIALILDTHPRICPKVEPDKPVKSA